MFDAAAVATYAAAELQAVADGGESTSLPEHAEPRLADQGAEIVAIDTGIANWETLRDSVPSGVEVVLIDAHGDGIRQLAEELAGRSGVASLHIVSHGANGLVRLGDTTLSSGSIDDYSVELQQIGAAMAPDGDILLYGCEVGEDGRGTAFLAALAAVTGADVAASDDLTGSSELGGDWDLEATAGEITASEVTVSLANSGFGGILTPGDQNFDGEPNQTVDNAPLVAGDWTIQWVQNGSVRTSGSFGSFIIGNGQFTDLDDGGPGDKILDALGTLNQADGVRFTSNGDPFQLVSFRIALGAAAPSELNWAVQGLSGSTVVASQNFTVVDGFPGDNPGQLVSVSGVNWNNITAFQIVTQSGVDDISFFLDDIDVSPAVTNSPPTVDLNGGGAGENSTASFTENQAPVAIAPSATVTDADVGDQIVSMTVTLTTRPDGGSETLAVTNASGLSVTAYNSATGQLVISGAAAPSTYQTVLQSIVYDNDSENPTGGNRTITVVVNDGDANSVSRTATVSVAAVNDAPTLSGSVSLSAFFEDTTPTASALNALGLSAGDVDGTVTGYAVTADASNAGQGTWQYLDGATWRAIGSVSESAAVALSATTQIRFLPTANYNGTPGALTLRALDDTYAGGFSAATPVTVNTSSFTASGAFSSGTATVGVTVSAVNDEPVVGNLNGDTLSYTEGDGAQVMNQALAATVDDVDSANFDGGSLTVAITGGTANEDLGILNVGTGSGEIGLAGANVTFGGVVIGTFSGGQDGAALVVTFDAASSPAAAAALLNAITYSNDSQNPTGSRTVAFTLTDGDGGTATAATVTVNLTPVNDAPTITAGSQVFAAPIGEDSGPTAGRLVSDMLTTAALADPDGPSSGIAVTQVSGPGTWSFSTDGGGTWTTIASASDGAAVLLSATTQLRFAPNGATGGTAELRFKAWDGSDGATPSSGATIETTDASGGGSTTPFSSQVAIFSLLVNGVDDAPTVTASGGTTPFAEGGGAVAIDTGLMLEDVDSATLASATVSITGGFQPGADVLAFLNTNATLYGNIAVSSYDSGTGVLSLVSPGATATLTQWQNALRAVTFENTSEAPTTTDRTVSFVANDGGLASTAAEKTVTVAAANDAPTFTGAPATFVVAEDTATALDLSGATFADVDSGATPIRFVLTASAGTLSAASTVDVTVTGAGGAVLTLEGTAAAIEAYLGNATAITYTPPLNASGAGAATITPSATDLGASGGAAQAPTFAAITVDITPQNDPAAIAGDRAFTIGEGGVYTLAVADLDETDPDDAGAELTWTVTTAPVAGTLWLDADGDGTVNGAEAALGVGGAFTQQDVIDGRVKYRHDGGAALADSFAVDLRDGLENGAGVAGPETVSITVTPTNDAPVLAGLDATPAYTEGGAAVVLDADVSVSDEELGALNGGNGNFAGASASIARQGGANAQDVLAVASGGGLVVTGGPAGGGTISDGTNVFATIANTGAGRIQITFTDANGTIPTTALVNQVLRAITYENASDDPPTSVTLEWSFSDGNAGAQGAGGAQEATGFTTVSITPTNDAPTVTGAVNTAALLDTAGAQTIFSGVTIGDVDAGETDLVVEVRLSNPAAGTLSGGGFVDQGGGVYRLSGVTAAAATTALDALAFTPTPNAAAAGATVQTTFTVAVNDQTAAEVTSVSAALTITGVNDPPAVGGVAGETSGVVAGAGFQNVALLDDATVGNLDSADYDGGFLTITQGSGTANGSWGLDGVGATSGGDGAIAAGETISVGGVAIGTVHATDDGQGGNALRIALDASADSTRVQALVQALTYDAPSSLGDRGFTLTLNDGDGGADGGDPDTTAAFTVSVTPNPPVVTGLDGGAIAYTEGDGAVALDPDANAAVTDGDSANFAGGTLTASITAGGDGAEDVLSIANIGTGTGQISVSAGAVSYEGTQFGTIAGGTGGAPLVVTFDADATPAAVSALLQALRYENTDTAAPTEGARTISVTISDAAAGPGAATSTASVVTVTVSGQNDLPTVTGAPGNPTVVDTATATPFAALTVGDLDGDGGTIAITYAAANGTLSGTGLTGVAGSYTLTGANPTELTARLQALVFTPTANQVAPGGDVVTTFTLTPNDGTANGAPFATAQVTAQSINDAPTASDFVAGQGITDKATVAPFATVDVVDPDTGQPLTVTVTLDDAAKGAFTAASLAASGFTGAGGVYTLNAANAGAAQAALRALVFQPTENRVAPLATETTSFTISVTDGVAAPATNATTTVVATSVNDAPTATTTIPAQEARIGEAFNLVLPAGLFIDADVGDAATLTVENLPPGLGFDPATRTISGTLTAPIAGGTTFTLVGTDLSGARTTITVALAGLLPENVPDAAPPSEAPPNELPPGPPQIAAPPQPEAFVPEAPPPPENFGGPSLPPAPTPAPAPAPEISVARAVDPVAPRSSFYLATAGAGDVPGFGIRSGEPIGEVRIGGGTRTIDLSLPPSTFVVENPGAQVLVGAILADGSPLPGWLSFDPATGTFTGAVPEGFTGRLEVMITATLPTGESASTTVVIEVEAAEDGAEPPEEAPPEEDGAQRQGAITTEPEVDTAREQSTTQGKLAFTEAVKAASRGAWATQGQQLLADLIAVLPGDRPSDDIADDARGGREAA